jgi:hypothetical protein
MGSIPTDFAARAGSPEQSVRYIPPPSIVAGVVVERGGVEYILERRCEGRVRFLFWETVGILIS